MQTTQPEAKVKMDYDELTLNPLLADEMEADEEASAEIEKKSMVGRSRWTSADEELFFKIWGRENWRLTRHGKNTVYFAQWAKELRELHDVRVRPEEVQQKVNQTRAKFRAVQKQIAKGGPRWKKYDLIESILNNEYRPKDAEPIPTEILKKSRRDKTAAEKATTANAPERQPTPGNTSNSMQEAMPPEHQTADNADPLPLPPAQLPPVQLPTEPQQQQQQHDTNMPLQPLADTNTNHAAGLYAGAELYNNHLEPANIKQEEYDEPKAEQPPYANNYHHHAAYPQYAAAVNHYEQNPDPPQLHQLQTPQQQQHQQQHQQQMQHAHAQYQTHTPLPPNAASAVGGYDHSNSVYGNTAVNLATNSAPNSNHPLLPQTHYDVNGGVAAVATSIAQNPMVAYANHNQYSNSAYASNNINNSTNCINSNINTSSSNNNNNHNENDNDAVAMPMPSTSKPMPAPRGRRRGSKNNCLAVANAVSASVGAGMLPTLAGATAANSTGESLETAYMEEVRKKNFILEEHKNISRKRMELEERKITLMQEFFPKCLELQQQILQKLNSA